MERTRPFSTNIVIGSYEMPPVITITELTHIAAHYWELGQQIETLCLHPDDARTLLGSGHLAVDSLTTEYGTIALDLDPRKTAPGTYSYTTISRHTDDA